jgi:GDP-4-dehydro-6-deoxy-D-mannose reductase
MKQILKDLYRMLNHKTILIAGINGFVGNHLAHILRDNYPQANVFGIDLFQVSTLHKTFVVDLRDKSAIVHLIQDLKPDCIFHLAGVIYSSNWDELFQSNVQTTSNLLESLKLANISSCRVVIPGSAAEYGLISPTDLPLAESHVLNPITPYGVAKAWQTTIARYFASQGVNVLIGRIFNLIGKGASENSSIGSFENQLRKIKNGTSPPEIVSGNLTSKRDFIDISDACQALIDLAIKGKTGEIYNICSGKSISMEQILLKMIERLGLEIEIVVDSKRIKKDEIWDIYGTNKKINIDVGWEPRVPIDVSIQKIFADDL